MAIRVIFIAIGILVMSVGISQLLFASWWIKVSENLVRSSMLRFFGSLALLIGVALVYGAVAASLNLRWFIWILGIWLVVMSTVIVFAPGVLRRFFDSIYLSKPRGKQLRIVYIAGFIRLIIGVIVLYAVLSVPCNC